MSTIAPVYPDNRFDTNKNTGLYLESAIYKYRRDRVYFFPVIDRNALMNLFHSKYFALYLRIALGVAFLSSVADRFGLWGAAGEPNVFWGNFQSFLHYTALLNPYCSSSLIPALGWVVTIAEVLLGMALILGIRIRETAAVSGILLFCFAMGQIAGMGIKVPLDYSVFTGSAACFLLSSQEVTLFSVERLLGIVRRKT